MKIGLVGWKIGENSFGSTVAYMEYLALWGDVLILPPSHSTFDVDLLVLPGGQDTLSSNYGQVPSYLNSNPDLMKEFFYQNNLKDYIERKTPILGICLGIQMINNFFGGRLDQNCGHKMSEKGRDDLVHEIKLEDKYRSLNPKNKVEVNSMHHQGIPLDGLGEDLELVASHDGIVEVLKHRELPIWGVQYHPEEIYDKVTTNILNTFTNEKVV